MSIFHQTHVGCDAPECGAHCCVEIGKAPTKREARRRAGLRGWFRIGGKDYCPLHGSVHQEIAQEKLDRGGERRGP